ncbi:glycosyltransferase family 76 protein [Paxillus rubicundulus Ve08.2h10]|uniref:GPI mannosyltransferase 2 n=1 Tax=Paxillus rubicundulus Ve08.2h10 TaxID=930991 RepID=A0A0D0E8U3_9AGAM|nr:glycosyltransferase family 76 protein [Paxillus rubicundulus Ve08.2h10]
MVTVIPSLSDQHLRSLTVLALLSRFLIATLTTSSTSLLKLFDSSPRLVLGDAVPPWTSSLLRWDAFHFARVAQEGHFYEHEWAFFPALPFVMHMSGSLLSYIGFGPSSPDWSMMLLGGAILAALFDSTRVLYRLSLHHLHSPSAAFLATALSLLPSSAATLRFASYSEPFFTYFSYRGMLACARSQWLSASVWFTLASAFRSNGILLSGFIVWNMLVAPYLSARRDILTPSRILYCTVLVAIPLMPFIHHNYKGYTSFCTTSTENLPNWCEGGLFPSIYSHVQLKYWNVGFLRYWTLSNIPNFILASPVLLNVYVFCAFYLSRLPRIFASLAPPVPPKEDDTSDSNPSLFLAPSLLPHVLHGLALTLVLTFSAHVQISLRVLPSLPMTYWAAARLLIERPKLGKAWVGWSIVWGALSCILWAVFLPPA